MALLLRVIIGHRHHGHHNHHHHHHHHPQRSLLVLLLITTLIVLSLAPSIECIFKMVKKKKFMEGFLVGFLVGNEYAAHKGGPTQHKGPPDYYGGMGGMGMGMPAYGGGFDAHMPYLPKKRSFRVGKPSSSSLSSRFTLRRRSNLLQHHQQQLRHYQSPRSLGGRSSRRGRVKKSSRSQAPPHFPSPSSDSQIAALSPSFSSPSSSTIKFPVYIRKSSSSPSSSPSSSGS